jgi:major vault protein
LERGIQNIYVLAEEEALLLKASAQVTAGKEIRKPGERWLLNGPCDYIPPIEVEVLETRKMIPLGENEGIYVRDITTGHVRAGIGQSYMLKANEELWSKVLIPEVEKLLSQEAARGSRAKAGTGKTRDLYRVVSFRVPDGAAVQVFDYQSKKSRVVFGPELVLLKPDESFTMLDLSSECPKRPNQIQTIALFLGPDFMNDQIVVETSDHACLALKLSYSWFFDVDKANQDIAKKMFYTPDFVGDLCRIIGARVRGVVAQTTFDDFHKQSVDIIRRAVFGIDSKGVPNTRILFPSNGLVVTNIDVQSVEPVDQKTKDSLQKSVQLAIEITTKSQEANARHEADRLDQEAQGKLHRQKLVDEAEAEKSRKDLLTLKADSAAVESTGAAKAEAKARAEAALIEGEAAVKQAELQAKSQTIAFQAEIEELKNTHEMEVTHKKLSNMIEVERSKKQNEIEISKFKQLVKSIGPQTIQAIAQAGPEMQAKLLSGLGVSSIMITDGNSPINLFNTANGLIAPQMDNKQ